MEKVYLYKLTCDDGGAPCIHRGTLSLAICKPMIRSAASEGCIALGFAADCLYDDNCVVYVARVTKKLDGRRYFSSLKYTRRPDCIYRWNGSRFEWKRGSEFHSPKNLAHDLGEPPDYRRANVLLSRGTVNFRYFGNRCQINYKDRYPRIKSLIERLGQGHRVNYEPLVEAQLGELLTDLWKERSIRSGPPLPGKSCLHSCGTRTEGCVEVRVRPPVLH